MRVLVFSSYWPRKNQVHKATFEAQQVAALADAGHFVEVIVQTEPWRLRAKFLGAADLGLDTKRVRVRQIVVPRFPEFLGRFSFGIRANIWMTGRRLKGWIEAKAQADRAPDLIIVHGERNVGLSAGIWNERLKLPAAMIVHGADPVLELAGEAFLRRHAGTVASAGLKRVILVGNRLRPYTRHLGYDHEMIEIIPNGFHHPRSPQRPSGQDDGPVRLVSVARLVPVKGIDDTLRALAAILGRSPNLDWTYDIVGDGPERADLEALTRQLGLEARVQFLGAMPNEHVLGILENSAIFALPSWNEAFGIAYLEAMAMGATVVGCRENGAADIITDGVDGCLVPPRNIDALSRVLEDLISDPRQRETLSRAAMVNVKRFSWAENARAVIEAAFHE